ncbi:MAG: ParA family protein [Ignavibacteriales bacterium]
MAVSVSIINMKGGVGKTTLAFNLAGYAAYDRRLKVLLVDLDPQANLSQYVLGRKGYKKLLDDYSPTVFDVFEQFTPVARKNKAPNKIEPQEVIIKARPHWGSSQGCIDLIPSRLELFWTLRNPTGKEHLLARFIGSISEEYDLILIDCAPTESILTTSAYLSSDHVVVPVKPEFLAAIGLPLLVRSLELFKQSYEDQRIEMAGIVFNDARDNPEHDLSRSEVKDYASRQGWYVFQHEIKHSDSYPRGARTSTPISRTDYARWTVTKAFRDFGAEFIGRVGLP